MQNFTFASLETKAGPVPAPGADDRLSLLSGLDAGLDAPAGYLLQDWPASFPRPARVAERLEAGLGAAGDAR